MDTPIISIIKVSLSYILSLNLRSRIIKMYHNSNAQGYISTTQNYENTTAIAPNIPCNL